MNLANLRTNSEARDKLEKAALMAICACYYYDLADTVDSMTDAELEEIVANKGVPCELCNED
ncbi:MAG TPA: hypothetical protein PKD15_05265 [Candidatus Saccharibacteria bacterium]|nr:hypothetical protein [Candidatus Saccharibacteria bacterium]